MRNRVESEALLRIQLHNQVFVNFAWQILSLRTRLEGPFQLAGIYLYPNGLPTLLGDRQSRLHPKLLLGLFSHRNHIAWLYLVGRNIHDLTIHQNALVRDQLTRL